MTGRVLVFDASPLIHFARANELGALRDLVKDFDAVPITADLGMSPGQPNCWTLNLWWGGRVLGRVSHVAEDE
jgi:hypothetical protein